MPKPTYDRKTLAIAEMARDNWVVRKYARAKAGEGAEGDHWERLVDAGGEGLVWIDERNMLVEVLHITYWPSMREAAYRVAELETVAEFKALHAADRAHYTAQGEGELRRCSQ